VQFDAPLGKLTAYLSPDPPDRKRRPAILWISGGDNTLNHERWTEGKADDEQSATVFRRAGLMMMCASLRGNEDNPGYREGFWGEVDDILAAGEYLKKHRYVDPKRIYLGGHSTGGTLALLAAECSDQFRAVFCFGPASNVGGYKKDYCPFFLSDPRELELRAPIRWLHSIKSPVFVFEGANAQGTNEALQRMSAASKNKQVQFFSIPGGNHFNVLAPTNFLIADRIVRDSGPKCTIAFTLEELTRTLQAAARK
jgi:dipeptidyl aminopeptidase/acylaminoacyl peptidase